MREDIVSFAGTEAAGLPFTLAMAGISYCDGTYRIRRRHSPVAVFEYVERGEGTVSVNGKTFTASAGDVYLLPRGTDQDYASSRNAPWTKWWMNVTGPLTDSLIALYRMEGVYHVPGYDALELFGRILAAARSGETAERVSGRTALLCHELLQGLSERIHAGGGDEPSEALALRRFIEGGVERDIDMAAMAAHIYRSPSQAIRLFRKAYGVTPCRYLADKRMESARLLLRNTRLPVGEIAERLRFADGHYFSNRFRVREGVTPTRYRQRGR